jgi:eukaryotic-like serine/threonine-protein kinase
MSPEEWQQVKNVFHAARALPVRERAAYVETVCAGDVALREEVEALLAADDETGDFLAQPALPNQSSEFVSEERPLLTGQRLGQYEIRELLGEGGMGQVYLARDVKLGRLVALKTLRAAYCSNPERVRRFQQEAYAASALNHPNILTIYEVDHDNELDFIVTEFIKGQTLRALLKAGGMTIGQVLDFVIQVGKALEAAHAAGIVHRDIKPENLMQRTDGYVKVLDFGLAKLTESQDADTGDRKPFSLFSTRPGVVMGTATYMSPEQARGFEVDRRTDIFSLGIVLYEMLTGRVPFEGQTASDVIAAIIERQPRPLESHISGLPDKFQHIIHRALQKNVEERYANIGQMLDELHKLKQDLELASNLKRYGKNKSAEDSLLNMQVGKSQVRRPSVDHETLVTNQQLAKNTASRSTFWTQLQRHPVRWVAGLLILGVAIAALTMWRTGNIKIEMGDAIESVAVLPFADQTNDAQLNYLPDGLTESLINSLSRLPNLRVMASGSVFQYKNRELSPKQIGQELKVSAIVSGRVQKAGDKLLISVELADTKDGARLWGEQYQRSLSDLVSVQNEIVREITQQMRVRLSGEQEKQLARRQPINNEAYQHYLKGRFHFVQYTRASQEKALEHFQQAIAADPGYALAYTGIADFYSDFSGQYLLPSEAMPKAKAAAMRALELDPSLAEAHHSLALVHWWGDWDFAGAETEFKRAIELNSNAALTMAYYAEFLMQMRRTDEALTWAQRGSALDPLSTHASVTIARVLLTARRYDEALAQTRKSQDLNPNYLWSYSVAAQALAAQGRFDAALVEIQRGIAINRHDSLLTVQAYLLSLAGKPNEARQILTELEQQAPQRLVAPAYLARVYIGLNDTDRALELLRRAYDEHSDHVLWLGSDRMFDKLRSDARFINLLKQIGLPQ